MHTTVFTFCAEVCGFSKIKFWTCVNHCSFQNTFSFISGNCGKSKEEVLAEMWFV